MGSKKAIMLFSGGKDSFLATCCLIEQGYFVYMVTFENGAGLRGYNAKYGADRIIRRYGENKAKFLGVQCVAGIWREFFLPYFNMKPKEILEKYGELTVSQYHCLTCRTSMYIWSIIKAEQIGVKNIADGARKVQGFVIELPGMIKRFKEFFSEFSMELILPVYDLDSDWEKKDLLLMKGFVPKTIEPQCLVGVPLPNGKAPDLEVQSATERFFESFVEPVARKIIKENKTTNLDLNGSLI